MAVSDSNTTVDIDELIDRFQHARDQFGPSERDRLQARAESTRVGAGPAGMIETTQTPGGSTMHTNRFTGESTIPEVDGMMARFRRARDNFLLEKLANNPIQEAAAPLIAPFSNALAGAGYMDEVENIAKGMAVGSLVIPDDAAVDPEKPDAALQLAGTFIGAFAEGGAADYTILHTLNKIRTTAAATNKFNTFKSAQKALDLFGAGEDATRIQQIMGGAALAGTSEIGLRVASGEFDDPMDIINASAQVAVGGAALGGAIAQVGTAARFAKATPRGLIGFGEAWAREGGVQPMLNRQAELGIYAKPDIQTPMAETNYAERVLQMMQDAKALEFSQGTGTFNGRLDSQTERIFDRPDPPTIMEKMRAGFEGLHDSFRQAFEHEASLSHLPDPRGSAGLTMADRFRELQIQISRSSRLADKDVQNVVAPLRAIPTEGLAETTRKFLTGKHEAFGNAWAAFERIVVLRDLVETARRGGDVPDGMTLNQLEKDLIHVETTAHPAALEAAARHKALVNEWRVELIRMGRLNPEDGFDYYFPHIFIEDLARADMNVLGQTLDKRYPTTSALERGKLRKPFRPETRRREGSVRRIQTDYLEVMFHASRRFHADNAVEGFIKEIETMGLTRDAIKAQVGDAGIRQLDRHGQVLLPDGQVMKIFHPQGPGYYRTHAVNDEAYNAFVKKLRNEGIFDPESIPELREILAKGKPKELILPKELADRLEVFYQRDSLYRNNSIVNLPAKAVQWWKRNTIWWGLSRFFVFQLLGDNINLLRSNPAAFFQIRNGRPDSPYLRALNETAKANGFPLVSKEQAFGTAVGSGAGFLSSYAGEHYGIFEEDDLTSDIGMTLWFSVLGYTAGSRVARAANRMRGPTGSEWHDLADKMGAINVGYTHNVEEVARRTLGESASAIPGVSRSLPTRVWDTMRTVASGKIHGDPMAVARIPAEIIYGVQIERENLGRLADFMQRVEKGQDPRLAAKAARESLVDYGKFTDWENRHLRSFWLPFYAFYRHNIPNWIKAAAGRDVGGKKKTAMGITAGLAAADIGVQMWNETFFPEVEMRLQDFRREQFHIIVGNPFTGEAFTDKNGKPMVVGWEMPYEQALEFFGLARPGELYSRMVGLAGQREQNVSMMDGLKRTAKDVALLKGIRERTAELLSPVIKLPYELLANHDTYLNEPIVPNHIVEGSPERHQRMLDYAARSVFRQYREAKRTQSDITGHRFDPLTSAFGLGLPITYVNMDREIQGYLHEEMDKTQLAVQRADVEWRVAINDVIYNRENLSEVAEGEPGEVWQMLQDMDIDPNQRGRAWRYYMGRSGQSALTRRFKALTYIERAKWFNNMPQWAQDAAIYYLNGGSDIVNDGGLSEQSGSVPAAGG